MLFLKDKQSLDSRGPKILGLNSGYIQSQPKLIKLFANKYSLPESESKWVHDKYEEWISMMVCTAMETFSIEQNGRRVNYIVFQFQFVTNINVYSTSDEDRKSDKHALFSVGVVQPLSSNSILCPSYWNQYANKLKEQKAIGHRLNRIMRK